MAYSLEHFSRDCGAALESGKPLQQNLDQIALHLRDLLKNPDFVAATFTPDTPPGKVILYHDKELDFYIGAHTQQAGKGGAPHSHGESWAVYGNATGFTDMTEWRRVNPESEDHAVLEVSDKYSIGPGQSRAYGPNTIHSTAHQEKCWVIRITGGDLDKIPRFQFHPRKDKILEKA